MIKVNTNSSFFPLSPPKAELNSRCGERKLIFTCLGYAYPDREDSDKHYKMKIEYYEYSDFMMQKITNRFTACDLKKCYEKLSKPRSNLLDGVTLLEPMEEYPSIKIKINCPSVGKPYVRRRRHGKTFPLFSRNISGLYVEFQLKANGETFLLYINRVLLKQFTDGLKNIYQYYSE